MSSQRHNKDSELGQGDARWLLDHWRFTGSANGSLEIRPLETTLSCVELKEVMKGLPSEGVEVEEVVFDFGAVRAIEGSWTLVFALLIDFARRSRTRCRIKSVHGQLAAVVTVYRLQRVIETLFPAGEPLLR